MDLDPHQKLDSVQDVQNILALLDQLGEEGKRLILQKLSKTPSSSSEDSPHTPAINQLEQPNFQPSTSQTHQFKIQRKTDSFATFEKRSGTVSSGDDYEIVMCGLYALKLSLNDDVANFQMTSNESSCGAFDDIKLQVKFKNGTDRTFMIQLKHKDTKKALSNQDFFPKQGKGDFSIVKYYNDLPKKVDSDTFLIIYTNCKANAESGVYADGISVEKDVQMEYQDLMLNTQEASAQDTIQFKFTKVAQDIYLFAKQKNLFNIKEDLKDMLKQLLQCDVYSSFFFFMKEWWSGRFVLTRHDFIAKVTELTLSTFLKCVSGSKQNEKTNSLKEAIMEFQLTLVKNHQNDVVQSIWLDVQASDVYSKMAQKFALTNPSHLNPSKILWFLEEVPLVVTVTASNREIVKRGVKFLGRSFEDKKIVLIGDVSKHDFEEFHVFENISDLSQKHEDMLQNFRVCLQGRSSVSVEDLRKIDEDFMKVLELDHLLQMSQSDLIIGEKIVESENHMKRIIQPHSFNTRRILKHCEENIKDVVIITCNDSFKKWENFKGLNMMELSDFITSQKVKNKLVLLSKKCTINDFEKVCSISKASNIYLFQVGEEENCFLLMSKGHPLNFETESLKINEKDVHLHFDNPLSVFCAPPGMGKTTLMEVLFNNTPPQNWGVYINLIKYNSVLSKRPNKETLLAHFLGLEQDLESQFKKIFVKRNKLHLYLDGLDEVDSKNLDFLIKFIKKVSGEVTVWVSSRENLREKLSQDLYSVPLEIQELDEEQQRSYISKRLGKYGEEKISRIVSSIFESSDVNGSRGILGIPLQLFIITELFLNNEDAYQKLGSENMFVLTKMYSLYFEGKKKSAHSKVGIDEEKEYQLQMNYQNHLEQYEVPALKSCLDEADFEKLQVDESKGLNLLKEIRKNGDKYGIIKSLGKNDIVFTHQTYAEYFASLWFKKNFKQARILRERIFSKRYENLRVIFDVMLGENNPLHLSIIYKNLEQFERYVGNTDDKDLGGRTALCLACTYGRKYPKKPESSSKHYSNLKRESPFFLEIIKVLLQGANVKERDVLFNLDCVSYAIRAKCLYPIEKMLELKILTFDELKKVMDEFFDFKIVLGYAAQFGYPHLLSELVSYDSINLLTISILGTIDDDYFSPRVGNIEVVRILIQNGFNPNENLNKDIIPTTYTRYSYPFTTSLDFACKYGCYDMLEPMIQNGAKCSSDQTILQATAEYNTINETVLDLCLKLNIDFNESGFESCTALHILCKNGNVAAVKKLIEKGVDVKLDCYKDLLHYMLRKVVINDEILDVLIEAGFDVNARDYCGESVLLAACSQGHEEVIGKLLERGANAKDVDETGNNALHYIADGYSSKELVTKFIKLGVDVNACNKKGKTPLHIACERENTEIVKILLESGARVNFDDHNPLFILFDRIMFDESIAIMLIDAGIDVNARNNLGQTALHLACEKSRPGIVKKLLEKDAQVNVFDNSNNNTLYYATKTYGKNEEVLCMLIEAGLDLNYRYGNGQTVLHHACQKSNGKVVKKLLEIGFDVNVVDSNGNNACHTAAEAYNANFDILTMLIKAGLDINFRNNQGQTVLHLVCERSTVEVARKLLETAKVDVVDNNDNNVLYYALKNEEASQEMLNLLLSYTFDINVRNKLGQTVLHLACEHGDLESVKKLIENEIDVNILDNDNNNALFYALQKYSMQNETLLMLAGLLIDAGLNLNVGNTSGRTLLHLTCQKNKVEVVKLLIEHGANVNLVDNDDNNVLYFVWSAPSYADKTAMLRLLLGAGLDVNNRCSNGQTVLHLACQTDDASLVEELLLNGIDVNVVDNDGNNVLHAMLQTHGFDERVLKVLIDGGIDVNARNNLGQTTLHLACDRDNVAVVKALTEKGVDVNVLDSNGNNILYYTSKNYKENLEILKLLVEAGLDVKIRYDDGRTLLFPACKKQNLQLVELLIAKKIDVNAFGNKNDNVLHACLKNYELSCQMLDLLEGIDVNARDKQGRTALHLACGRGDIEIVKKLLTKKAKINVVDVNGNNPLLYTLETYRINPEMLCLLIEAGLDINAKNRPGQTGLHLSCQKGNTLIVQKLIEKVDVDSVDNVGNNALHYASKTKIDTTKILDLLITKLGVNSRNNLGQTPVHLACHNDNIQVVKKLVENGGDANTPDKDGNMSLHFLMGRCNQPILDVLISAGANLNAQNNLGQTPLHLSCKHYDLKGAKMLVKSGASVKLSDKSGNTALHYVSDLYSDRDVGMMLLNGGVDVNARNDQGQVALHIACKNGSTKLVNQIVEKNGRVDVVDNGGNTALHYSCKSVVSNTSIIETLLSLGININDRNSKNETALHLACIQGALKNVKFLLEHGAEINAVTSSKRNILHYAVISNDIEVVSKVLDLKLDINSRDDFGRTALHLSQTDKISQELIQHEADVNAVDDENMTALHYTVLLKHDSEKLIQCLLKNGIDVKIKDLKGRDALSFAFDEENFRVIQIFIESGVFMDTFNVEDEKFLYYSVYSGSRYGVELFVKSNEDLSKINIGDEKFPLYFAVKNGKLDREVLMVMTKFIHLVIQRLDEKYKREILIHYLNLQTSKHGEIDFIFREVCAENQYGDKFREISKYFREKQDVTGVSKSKFLEEQVHYTGTSMGDKCFQKLEDSSIEGQEDYLSDVSENSEFEGEEEGEEYTTEESDDTDES